MSPAPTNRSPDLQLLRDEGYSISLVSGLLVIADVPFVTQKRKVAQGRLVVPLSLAGDRTIPPARHDVWWSGGMPCDSRGAELDKLVWTASRIDHGRGILTSHRLCNKPVGREFRDYHELVTTYVNLISRHAAVIDPRATARTRRGPVMAENPDLPFHYLDTATSSAGVGALAERLSGSIAIIGLGGTGAYVLDLVAKTPVSRIHLFDHDTFDQHNAFRAPGAASLEEIGARRRKVDHFASIYSRMHRGIVPHGVKLDRTNLALLGHVDFAFLCMDDGTAKRPIVERLERNGSSFIDVGMGLEATTTGILGSLRVTTSTPAMRNHVRDHDRIPYTGGADADPYASNIQVADLNALNAALAVIRWKKLMGFYASQGCEHFSVFGVDRNQLLNDDWGSPADATGPVIT